MITADDVQKLLDEMKKAEDSYAKARRRVGELLAKMREERGLTYRAAAELLQCDPSNLNKLEKGSAMSRPLIERAMKTYDAMDAAEVG